MKTPAPQSPQIETIHGFRVLPITPATAPFKRVLKIIASRGYADPSCVIVKTKKGSKFGDPPTDGKCVYPSYPFSHAVVSMMKDQGIVPPPMPFLFTSIPTLLYHEWGHHVDFCWSGGAFPMLFSICWFSHFYEVGPFNKKNEPLIGSTQNMGEYAAQWLYFSSELFVHLFEDWIRDRKTEETCNPRMLNSYAHIEHPLIIVEFLNGVNTCEVRDKTFALFDLGLKGPDHIPEVRPDLFGSGTSTAFARLKESMDKLDAKTSK